MQDDEAFGGFMGWVSALARTHARKLAAVARAEGLRSEDALDAVQDALRTFLLLPQARSLVDDAEGSEKLLGVLVRNAARNARRRAHRAAPHVPLDPEQADELPPVDELVDRAERHVRLAGCVNMLAELQRRVVQLRVLQELSGAEVAELLGLTPGHVAVQLHRAKKALLRCLRS
jgi:RNA polymerase sigma-70 factor (ECF subfamily)